MKPSLINSQLCVIRLKPNKEAPVIKKKQKTKNRTVQLPSGGNWSENLKLKSMLLCVSLHGSTVPWFQTLFYPSYDFKGLETNGKSWDWFDEVISFQQGIICPPVQLYFVPNNIIILFNELSMTVEFNNIF